MRTLLAYNQLIWSARPRERERENVCLCEEEREAQTHKMARK